MAAGGLDVLMQEWPPALQVNLRPVLAANLGVPLQVSVHGWNWSTFYTALLRGIQTGSAPDVIEVGSTWTSRLAHEGLLLDVTRLVTSDMQGPAVYFPRLLNNCRHRLQRDRYFAVPYVADVHVLFYNDDILADYLARHPHAFRTWDSFEDLCMELREVLPHRVVVWPLSRENTLHDCLPWIWASGGEIISTTGEVRLDSEGTLPRLPSLDSSNACRLRHAAAGLWNGKH